LRCRTAINVPTGTASTIATDHRDRDEPQRHLEPVPDLRSDGRLRDVGRAGVQRHQPLHPTEVLHGERPIQAELAAQLRHGLLRGADTERYPGRVARQHRHEPEDDDRAHGQACQQDPDPLQEADDHDVRRPRS
jgi:hypothetical protein